MENTRCPFVIVRLEQAVRKVFVDVVQNLQRALDWLLNDFFQSFSLPFTLLRNIWQVLTIRYPVLSIRRKNSSTYEQMPRSQTRYITAREGL